jgi:iron complex transport system ATP-binding protein
MVIQLKDVSWRRGEKMILSHISWNINKGEHWCLVGLNGSGKTSLLQMMTGYIWPTTGQVTVLGNRFGKCDIREIRKQIGWVSSSLQQRIHEHETAERIVLSGKFASIGIYDKYEPDDLNYAKQLLEKFRCQELIDRPYSTLSQGERQKVLIARGLMARPQLLILDEPCTGLDLFAREQLLQMIHQITQTDDGPTLIYVTHHIEEILPCFTHTLLLKQGEVYQAGQTEQVLTEEQLSNFFNTKIHLQEINQRKWISFPEAIQI